MRLNRLLLDLIVLGYWLVAGLFAVRTPDWQAPDEPAHYNYVAQIAENGVIPTIKTGDWDSAYLQQLTSSRFDPAQLDALDTVQYEDHQPPLYYALLSPVYSVTDGDLTALRLASVLIGTLIVLSAYGVAITMFPERGWLALATAGFVAFMPQHVAIIASVNNDALGWAIAGGILWATTHYLKHDRVKTWHLGLLMGIGFITKATTYFMAGLIPLAILLKWWTQTRANNNDTSLPYKHLIVQWTAFLVPALMLGFLWWGRNFDVYGFPDFMGLAAHDEVVIGQPRTADAIDAIGFDAYFRMGLETTFNSFWAQFGWMAVPLEMRWYQLIQAVLIFAGVGWLVGWVQARVKSNPHPPTPIDGEKSSAQRNVWIILILTIVLSMLAYLYYNSEFQQFQGRYMFTMLIPVGILIALGFDAWRRLIMTRLPLSDRLMQYTPYVILVPYALMAIWDIWLLWRVIVPNLEI